MIYKLFLFCLISNEDITRHNVFSAKHNILYLSYTVYTYRRALLESFAAI